MPDCDPDAGLAVGPSSIAGLGLFTTVARRAGERLVEITGELIGPDEAERRDGLGNVYIYEFDESTYVDAAAGLGRHVNHACQPSCRIEGAPPHRLWLIAAHDLPVNTELTIDYDYEEIFDSCRSHNPACLGPACPRQSATNCD